MRSFYSLHLLHVLSISVETSINCSSHTKKILTITRIFCSINRISFHILKKKHFSHNSDQLFVIRFYFPSFIKLYVTENDKQTLEIKKKKRVQSEI